MLLSLSVLISTSAVSLWHCFPLFTFSTVNLSARRLWPWSFKQQHKTWEGQCSSIVGSRYIFYVLKDRPEVIHKAHADLLPWTHGATSHQMELQLGGSESTSKFIWSHFWVEGKQPFMILLRFYPRRICVGAVWHICLMNFRCLLDTWMLCMKTTNESSNKANPLACWGFDLIFFLWVWSAFFGIISQVLKK